LLAAGAKLHNKDFYTTRLFETALDREHYSFAELILNKYPNLPINRPVKSNGKTVLISPALRKVSANGNLNWVLKLLDRGASLKGSSLSGYPIYGSAFNGHKDVVQALLNAGSPVNPQSEDSSLFEYLAKYEFTDKITEMREFLKSVEKKSLSE